MDEQLKASGGQPEHFDTFPRRPVPRSSFDYALLKLLRLSPRDGRDGLRDGRRAAMIAALDNRASYDTIRHWRRGRRQPPQWAIDLLTRQLDEIGRAAEQLRKAS